MAKQSIKAGSRVVVRLKTTMGKKGTVFRYVEVGIRRGMFHQVKLFCKMLLNTDVQLRRARIKANKLQYY